MPFTTAQQTQSSTPSAASVPLTAPAAAGQVPSEPLQFRAPQSIADTGLARGFLADLALKIIYFAGELTGQGVADEMRLPYANVTEPVLQFLIKEEFLSVTGSSGIGERGFKYIVTGKGIRKVQELLERTQYAGPAPVPLAQYNEVMVRQSIGSLTVQREQVAKVLSDLVVSETLLRRVGPAVNSARAMFLYGPAGNGKTTIAERISQLLSGAVYIPYAVYADGHIIRVFDHINHVPWNEPAQSASSSEAARRDNRWVKCRRPFITVGGELTLETLDLIFDPISVTYEAPFQMKANCGMFLIDDFGRQKVRPQDLLNRWIVPLEKRYDFLTLQTGKQLQIPFDVLVVFATNLDPKELSDEAFLRRIRHKIPVLDPSWDEFRLIFQRSCAARKIPYDETAFQYLVAEHYIKAGREPRAVHPRDLLDHIADLARYHQREPCLDKEFLDAAVDAYFVQI